AFPSWYTVYHDVDQRNQAGEDLEVKNSDID
ncbi:acyl-CoA thioesterase, partial [Staphylococcus pseudintermedius]